MKQDMKLKKIIEVYSSLVLWNHNIVILHMFNNIKHKLIIHLKIVIFNIDK